MTDRVETNEFRVEKLDNDYATWAVLFQASLEDKELWEAISEPQPDAETDPTGAAEWTKKDRRAFGRLKMSVALHHLPTVQACTSAKMAWDALEAVFTAKVNARRLQLAQDFALLKMTPGETLLGYSGRTRKLQLEMMATGHPYDDNTVIIHFLNGLPDAYKMEKKLLINQRTGAALRWDDVMPTLYPVENEVKEEAAKKEGPTVGAYAASAPGGSGSGTGSGLPAWPRDVHMPREERQKRVVCWTCGVRGHYQRQCTKGNSDRPPSAGGPSASFMALGGAPSTHVSLTLGTTPATGTCGQPASASMVGAGSRGAHGRTTWMIDSGATDHMQFLRAGFTTYAPEPSDVTIANGSSIHSPGHGAVHLSTSLGGTVTLGHALYVPGITANLLSVRKMAKVGKVTFEGDYVTIEQNGQVVATGKVDSNEQYVFNGATTTSVAMPVVGTQGLVRGEPTSTAAVAYGRANPVGHLWHRRFGHLGNANVAKVATLVTGMSIKPSDVKTVEGAPCVPCVQARMARRPHDNAATTTSQIEKLHVDLVGPLDPSDGGAVHFLSALCDATEMGFATPLKRKAAAGQALRDWVKHLELQTSRKVKIVRCDGAGELVKSADMVAWFKATGIKVETTAPYSPQMNGKAERLNRTIMERLRAVLLEYRLPKSVWAEVLMALFFLRNRSPTADGAATPYERFYGKKPDVAHFKVLGSPAYALQPSGSCTKLGSKTLLGTIVGYAANGHAYRIRSSATGNILVRRDVVADESLPVTPVTPSALPVCLYLPDNWATDASTASDAEGDGGTGAVPGEVAPSNESEDGGDQVDTGRTGSGATSDKGNGGSAPAHDESAGLPDGPHRALPTAGPAPLLAGPLPDGTSGAGHGYFLRHRAAADQHDHAALAALAPPLPAPLIAMSVAAAVARSDWCATPPKTRTEALARPDAYLWQQAMDAEMDSLRQASAWDLVDLPPGAKATGGRWVFDYKRDADGCVTRYKARFVAQGYTQRLGVDYTDVWAPCPARATVRAVLAMVAAYNLEMHVIDIKNAYLNAPMDLPVYVRQPEGYARGTDRTVGRLNFALYGCKQAGRLWGIHSHGTLTALGAVRSQADPTLYKWVGPSGVTVTIVAHVDDMAIAAATLEAVVNTKEAILAVYKGRDMGAAATFLGYKVDRDRAAGTLTLSCPGLTVALLEQFGLDAARPNQLPMPANTVLLRTGEQLLPDSRPYAELVGSLLYLSTSTRPDIAYAAGLLARFMDKPEEEHWRAAKGVLRYLVGTTDLGICYSGKKELTGAVDADNGGCRVTRRSTTGWVFTWNGGAISWTSKRQPTVSSSTAESEYVAAAAATREALWLRKLMADLGEPTPPVPIAEDNQACLSLIANPEGTGRAKHIDVAHHLVRERTAMGEVRFFYQPGAEMVADGLTKALPGPALARLKDGMGMAAPGRPST